LTIAAGIAIMIEGEEIKRIAAALLGIGLGLVLDEVGILLSCGTESVASCNPLTIYWSRLSYDIMIYAILIYIVGLFFIPVWYRKSDKILSWFKR
jgi:hypothetical protein